MCSKDNWNKDIKIKKIEKDTETDNRRMNSKSDREQYISSNTTAQIITFFHCNKFCR